MVGTFCRAYPVREAIEKFLGAVYAPSAMEGRYDYIPADSSAGVIIYDDKFAYSHHATDPASGLLLNAFDLVRIHKFGSLDDKASTTTAPGKMPSFVAMCEFAKERQAQAEEEFSDEDWQTALELDKQGRIKDTLDNIVLIIRHDEDLQHIAFNCHRDGIDAKGGLPWEQIKAGWNDSDNALLKVYLSSKYGVYSPTKTKDAVLAVASERAYHPVKEYLDSLHLPVFQMHPSYGIPRFPKICFDRINILWNIVTSSDFENEAKNSLLKLLTENSSGNPKVLFSSYLSSLIKFLLFLKSIGNGESTDGHVAKSISNRK